MFKINFEFYPRHSTSNKTNIHILNFLLFFYIYLEIWIFLIQFQSNNSKKV